MGVCQDDNTKNIKRINRIICGTNGRGVARGGGGGGARYVTPPIHHRFGKCLLDSANCFGIYGEIVFVVSENI